MPQGRQQTGFKRSVAVDKVMAHFSAKPSLGKVLNIENMVGVAGFEPTTTSPPDWCATRLRYTPVNSTPTLRQGGIIPYSGITSILPSIYVAFQKRGEIDKRSISKHSAPQ